MTSSVVMSSFARMVVNCSIVINIKADNVSTADSVDALVGESRVAGPEIFSLYCFS